MVKNSKRKIKGIYADTNFILDCTEGRNDDAIALITKIRDKKWKCVTSAFTMMEIGEVKKDEIFIQKKLQKKWSLKSIIRERYRKDLKNGDFEDVTNYIQNKILQHYPFIETINLPEAGWTLALEINTNSNITSEDAIHLATAWNAECNFLITSDKYFKDCAKKIVKKLKLKLELLTPSEFLKIYG